MSGLIPPRGIDDVFKRAAGFKAFDLARDIFRYFVGIGIGGVVRRQHDFWMGPERAVGRKRLIGEDIERRRAERAVVETCQNVGFVLQPAPPGIDQDRRAQRAVPVEFRKQPALQDMPRIHRERQQANENIGPFQERTELRLSVKAFDTIDPLRSSAPARDAKTYSRQQFGGVRPQRAKTHDADRNRACRPLKFWLPAFLALAGSQVRLLPMMHQYVKHDIFGHTIGEVADRNANQRHIRQARIGHQRIDPCAEIENHPQVRKCRQFARGRLPDRGVVHIRRIDGRIGQQKNAAVLADLVESLLPSLRRPVFGAAVNEQGQRAFVHRILASYIDRQATLAGCVSAAKYFRYPVGDVRTHSSSNQQELLRMLYAILCYHDEDTVGSWTKEQDAAVMKKLAVVQDKLTKQGRLGPVARLLPTTAATTLRKDDPPVVLDGPYAETKEQLLGFYVVDCKDLDEALADARVTGRANPGGAYEIRPVGMFAPGRTAT